ncbi:MAG: succinate dehydrogenase, hydrophobic membrane anchor protein [Erythrobacter sp.]
MGNGTSIGKVRGLGSSHHGAHHWLLQRFTAIGNLVLMGWLIASFILLPNLQYQTVAAWIASPISATAMVLLIISLFWHARLGLQVVLEDYVQDAGTKFGLFALLNIAVFGGGALAIFSVAKLALGGAA